MTATVTAVWVALLATVAAATPDAVRWRARQIAEHRGFAGVWVDTRELAPGEEIRNVVVAVSCLDMAGATLRRETFPFTDAAQPALKRGLVYLRYFRHSCTQAHQVVGERLTYAASAPGTPLRGEREATLRRERIPVPRRQLARIGASPFHTTDPSAYCLPLASSAAAPR